jgi:NADH-quinone oxidoreductase subunit L
VELGFMGMSVVIAFLGIWVAYFMYILKPELPGKLRASFDGTYKTLLNKWYVDEIYDALFVNPTKRLGTFLWKGFDVVVVDGIVNGFGKTVNGLSRLLRFTQSGLFQNYALTMVVGTVVIVAFYVFR